MKKIYIVQIVYFVFFNKLGKKDEKVIIKHVPKL